MVEMYCCAFLNKKAIILVVIDAFCRSISNFSLSAETNAISIPEKNPENSNDIMIAIIVEIMFYELLFDRENSCRFINLIFCKPVVGYESYAFKNLVFLLDSDFLFRIELL